MDKIQSSLDSFFKIKLKGSTVRTEVLAGLTTFATMAYILAVNVSILSATGLDQGALFVATALAAIIGTVLMGLLANLPFALAPGMGLNAFFAYTIVFGMGYSPQFALAAVFVEGIVFIILSVTNVRTKLFKAIPLSLKSAMGGGIGLFIMFIGMKNAGIVVANEGTLIGMGSVAKPEVAFALIGTFVVCALLIKNVKGALLIGIGITWFLGIIAQLTGFYTVDVAAGAYSLLPEKIIDAPPSIMPTLGLCFAGFGEIFSNTSSIFDFLIVAFSLLFVDIFDTLGTLSGVASKANMLDKNGNLENSDQAFLADAIATAAGAVLGTSTTTTYVESAAGVVAGGRTGLTAIVVAILFGLSLFFAPIFLTIPGFATATALIAVGILMVEPIKHLNFESLEDLVPLVITMVTMPFFSSISDGLFFGIISYIVVKAAKKKFSEISPVLWVAAIIFILKLIFF